MPMYDAPEFLCIIKRIMRKNCFSRVAGVAKVHYIGFEQGV